MIRPFIARLMLFAIYRATWLWAKAWGALPRRRQTPTHRLAVTGTFYNHNWFLSHAIPLGQSGVEEVIVVADEPRDAPPRVRFMCPPRWMARIFGRAFSKLIFMIVAGLRDAPDVYMGYHLFPGAITALLAARLFGRAACYQMTGGPIEIIGGGFHAENPLMSSLVRPSRMIERAALAVARQFDLIVVRGDKARQFLRQNGVTRRIVAITAGIATQPSPSPDGRVYDLVFVGRLSEIKQPLQFLEIVAAVQARVPAVRAAMVGDGPLGDAARRFAAERGIADRVDFLGQRDGVNEVLARSKIFVLTSRSEGLSIALLEALACGVPPVAARVGELSELIVDGQTGWLVTPDAIGEYVEHIITLLEDEGMRRRMSVQSWQGAMAAASVPRVAQRWNQVLAELGSVKRESEDVSPACPAPVCISEVSHV